MGVSLTSAQLVQVAPSGVSNLLDLFAQATTAEIAQGKAWYQWAYQEAQDISRAYGVSLETVVKVACALSPRLLWEANMPAAEQVIRHYVSGGYVPDIERYRSGGEKLQRTRHTPTGVAVISDDAGLPYIPGPTRVNIVKALWICQGHDWVLRGKKVNSFLDNILHWDTSTEVTVDSHHIQCWRGLMEEGTYAIPDAWYDVIVADTRAVAAMLGILPNQLQAILWLVKKRLVKQLSRELAKLRRQGIEIPMLRQLLEMLGI